MTGVIEYDAGNILSVLKALDYIGEKAELTNDRSKLIKCDRIVFPGVGAYYDAMESLKKNDLVDTIKDAVSSGMPFFGICLGMQLLFEQSEETIGADDKSVNMIQGLGLLKGTIRRFEDKPGFKIPHMGWNSLDIKKKDSRLFKNIKEGTFVYFVHSYYLEAARREEVAATTKYIIDFDSAVEKDNIFGCQFHPEKSGDCGLEILKNFCSEC